MGGAERTAGGAGVTSGEWRAAGALVGTGEGSAGGGVLDAAVAGTAVGASVGGGSGEGFDAPPHAEATPPAAIKHRIRISREAPRMAPDSINSAGAAGA